MIHTTATLLLLAVPAAALLQDDGPPPVAEETPALPRTASDADPALAELQRFIDAQAIDESEPRWRTSLPKPPKAVFSQEKDYFWHLRTNKGDMKIRLMPDVAPMHVSSTIYLTQLGFYDGLTFHRVIPDFMAQGGCPLGTGTGSPGYRFDGEFDAKVRHDRPGLLSMANAGPGTDGSQFFLTFVPTPHLNGKHTIFGEVVGGMDTLKKLESRGSRSGKTLEPLRITAATITVAEKPEAAGAAGGREAAGQGSRE